MRVSSFANRGKSLESIVLASQLNVVCLDKIPTSSRIVRAGTETKSLRLKSPPDFIGTVCGSGRAIVFDAKQCDEKRFPLSKIRPHQAEWIIRHGLAGAVAGVLIESTNNHHYWWLSWNSLDAITRARTPSIEFTDFEADCLGPSSRIIDFTRIPGVNP